MTRASRTKTRQRRVTADPTARDKLPFIEHLRELRRRLAYVAATVIAGGIIAYGFEHQIIEVLLRPSEGQELIYTSPMGGMNFLFTVCLNIGLLVATPVIVYQLLAFVRPVMQDTTRRFLLIASVAAAAAATAGVLFGYFVGLPSAMHFLLNQFTSDQVRPLITIQSYTQFVALYLLGSALMFQLPLIVLLINRIKPLKPQSLLKYERHVAVGSLIVALIINPSPRPADQLFLVIPLFLSYQIAIFLLWYVQRKQAPPKDLQVLREQDAQRQAERLKKPLQVLTAADMPALAPSVAKLAVVVDPVRPIKPVDKTIPATKPAPVQAIPRKQRRFIDFTPNTKPQLLPAMGHQTQIAVH